VEIYTIGFTQTTAEHFFGRLKATGILPRLAPTQDPKATCNNPAQGLVSAM
jgi:hypothetical protein